MDLNTIDFILYVLALVCFLSAVLARRWEHAGYIGWLGLGFWVLVPLIASAKAL